MQVTHKNSPFIERTCVKALKRDPKWINAWVELLFVDDGCMLPMYGGKNEGKRETHTHTLSPLIQD